MSRVSIPANLVARLAASVQPLVFELGIQETPYSVAGTLFLVGHKGRAFVVTARHALTPNHPCPICVFPSDASRKILPLKNVFYVPADVVPDDFMDLAVIEIDQTSIADTERGQALLIDIERATTPWPLACHSSSFLLMGYPRTHTLVDYTEELLHTERITLHARYVGPSAMPFLHELEILDECVPSDFSGFSGGPVFSWTEPTGARAFTSLCGVALRGSSTSRRVHYLDRSVLVDMLNLQCSRQP